MQTVYLVIAHGSYEKKSNDAFWELLKKLKKKFRHRKVEGAFAEIAKPSVPEVIDRLIQAGAQQIFVLPLMLFLGRHVKEDLPRFIQQAKAKHPGVDFHISAPLSDHPMFLVLLEQKLKTLFDAGVNPPWPLKEKK